MNELREQDIRALVERIVALGLHADAPIENAQEKVIPVEVSARHVHLNQSALELLFGPGVALHEKRPLSQPGQFLAEERVRLVGPKGVMENVAVLGPVRNDVQVELSLSDARAIGVQAPVRQSGDLTDAGEVYLVGPYGMMDAKSAVIAARAHIHMTPWDAKNYAVCDGACVRLRLHTDRPITLENVVVRVNENFSLAAHIDVDEANAAHFSGKERCTICSCADGADQTTPSSRPVCAASEVQSPAVSAPGCRKKQLITEEKALEMVAAGLSMPEGPDFIVTPLAKDVFLHAARR